MTNFEAELLDICDQLKEYLPHPDYLILIPFFFPQISSSLLT